MLLLVEVKVLQILYKSTLSTAYKCTERKTVQHFPKWFRLIRSTINNTVCVVMLKIVEIVWNRLIVRP